MHAISHVTYGLGIVQGLVWHAPHLSSGDAPILAIHGTDDELVPYAQATSLIEACHKAGIEASLITIDNGRHGSGGKPEDWHAANLQMIEFFNRHLKANDSASRRE